jgi:hypothetical protein
MEAKEVQKKYLSVIGAVIEASKADFADDGIDAAVLDELQRMWTKDLEESGVTSDTHRIGWNRGGVAAAAPAPRRHKLAETAKSHIDEMIDLCIDADPTGLGTLLKKHCSKANVDVEIIKVLQKHGWDGSGFVGAQPSDAELGKLASDLISFVHQCDVVPDPEAGGLHLERSAPSFSPLATRAAMPSLSPLPSRSDGQSGGGSSATKLLFDQPEAKNLPKLAQLDGANDDCDTPSVLKHKDFRGILGAARSSHLARSGVPKNAIPQVDGLHDDDSDDEGAAKRARYADSSDLSGDEDDEDDTSDGGADDGEELGSDDDALSDGDDDADEESPNLVLCHFVKVKRSGSKWKVDLKGGVMQLSQDGQPRDYVFNTASGVLEWG